MPVEDGYCGEPLIEVKPGGIEISPVCPKRT
jgi:hypothetical protein